MVLVVVSAFLMSVPVQAATFKTWDDGTAFVKGRVVEHTSGCEVDGACSLIIDVNGERVALVYAEGEQPCANTEAASFVNWGKNVKKGTVVAAYGAYKKFGDAYHLDFCESRDYFILGENDPLPTVGKKPFAEF